MFSVKTGIVQSCIGSRLELTCPATEVIQIESIRIGLASCERATCCVKDAGCDQKLSDKHVAVVHRTCNNQQYCTVDIQSFIKQPCTRGWWVGKKSIDGIVYEKIAYTCRKGPESK